MTGRAAIIAVLLAPTASIAKHDDHRTDTEALGLFWGFTDEIIGTGCGQV